MFINCIHPEIVNGVTSVILLIGTETVGYAVGHVELSGAGGIAGVDVLPPLRARKLTVVTDASVTLAAVAARVHDTPDCTDNVASVAVFNAIPIF